MSYCRQYSYQHWIVAMAQGQTQLIGLAKVSMMILEERSVKVRAAFFQYCYATLDITMIFILRYYCFFI